MVTLKSSTKKHAEHLRYEIKPHCLQAPGKLFATSSCGQKDLPLGWEKGKTSFPSHHMVWAELSKISLLLRFTAYYGWYPKPFTPFSMAFFPQQFKQGRNELCSVSETRQPVRFL